MKNCKTILLRLLIVTPIVFGSLSGYGNFLENKTFKQMNKPVSEMKKRRGGSDFSLGAQLNFNMYSGAFKMLGLGITGEYGTDVLAYRGSVNYFFPKKYETSYYGNAYSSATTPQYITVNGNYSIGIIHLAADGKKIFGKRRDYSDGGVYGFAGAGLTLASVKSTIDPYDSGLYDIGSSGGNETISQFNIRAGLGFDGRLDFGALFAEVLLILPANSVNGVAVDINIPTAIGATAGIRIPIGG